MKKMRFIPVILSIYLPVFGLSEQPKPRLDGTHAEVAELHGGPSPRKNGRQDGNQPQCRHDNGATARQTNRAASDTVPPHVRDYVIHFSRSGRAPFNLRVDCTFTLFRGSDSIVTMRFGGDPAFSVSALRINVTPHAAWRYDPEKRTISFALSNGAAHSIRMRYSYCNFTSAFLYGNKGCELWELAFGEFFYPHLFGDRCTFDVRSEFPDGMVFVGGYPAQELPHARRSRRRCRFLSPGPLVSHAFVFALLDTARYRESIHIRGKDTLHLWLMREPAVPQARIDELHRLTCSATAFFEDCFGPYDDPAEGIAQQPVYVLHSNGYANRNNLNLISVSQEKFATKPHLLPIVHEIGHRWLGEWTLLVPDGAEAAYFLKESLNEYMTLLYVRASEGEDSLRRLLATDYLEPYRALRGTGQDERLISLRYNNNDAAVYIKGPLLLDRVASRMGQDRWIAFMGEFYRMWSRRPGLTYQAFLRMLAVQDPEAAELLDSLVRTY